MTLHLNPPGSRAPITEPHHGHGGTQLEPQSPGDDSLGAAPQPGLSGRAAGVAAADVQGGRRARRRAERRAHPKWRQRRRWRILRRGLVLALVLALVVTAVRSGQAIVGEAVLGTAKLRARAVGLRPIEVAPLPERSVLLAGDGSPLATLYLENRIAVEYADIAPVMIQAIVAVEDRRFFKRDGIDIRAIGRAFATNLRGRVREGGSTIPQQYVKNILSAQADTPEEKAQATAPTYQRKLEELWYAHDLEARMTREEILGGYLNTVFFGAGAYGLGAAAARFFSTTVDQLTLTQAATLAGLVRSPSLTDPLRFPDAALARRNEVLAAMNTVGQIDAATYRAARAEPLGLVPSLVANGCAVSSAPYFCEWVRVNLENEPALGATVEERRQRLELGGLTITTTLDLADQAAAQEAVADPLGYDDRVAATVVTVEPGTGRVRAMAANRVFGLNAEANETTVLLPDRPYTVGSTFKAFTLAAALEAGVPLNTILPGGATYRSPGLDNPDSGYFSNAEGGPTNLNLSQATTYSVNTAFVQLQERVGVLKVAETARRMGAVSLPLDGPNAVHAREGSLTLGARELTPLEMANSYATLASGGLRCTPTGVAKLVDRSGVEIQVEPQCVQALSPAVAATVTSLLAGVVTGGTGTRAQVNGYAIAGKTGTTEDYGSAWFVGYTPQLSTSVWLGDPRGPSYALRNVAGYGAVYGGTIPASIFSRAMTGELEGEEALPLPGADPSYLGEAERVVPDLRGLPASVARARLGALGVTVTGIKKGTVARSDPAAGAVLDGSPVRLEGNG